MIAESAFLDTPAEILKTVGSVGNWLHALGIVVVLGILFEVVAFFMNRKRLKEIAVIKKDMRRIESKIDALLIKRR